MRAIGRSGIDPRRLSRAADLRDRTFARQGRFNTHGRGARVVTTLPPNAGWHFDNEVGLRFRPRRVVVKTRIVKLRGHKSRTLYAHLRYLKRDGITEGGER